MEFINTYNEVQRAESYAKLEFPGTYYLAYRDLPEIITRYAKGRKALDFGCGAGRSTRFLVNNGFQASGVDISQEMIKLAREIDIYGDYRCIKDGDFSQFSHNHFDLILSAFTFDNIPGTENKTCLFEKLGNLLNNEGIIINLVSSPDIYFYEWASFSTKNFPQNRYAKTGDKVKIIMTDVEDQRPVVDIIWPDEDYQKVYKQAGLKIVNQYKPLGRKDEPYQWINETNIAPWVIYILKKKDTSIH